LRIIIILKSYYLSHKVLSQCNWLQNMPTDYLVMGRTRSGFGLQAVASVKCPGGPSTRAYGVYGGLDPASCAGFSYAGYLP